MKVIITENHLKHLIDLLKEDIRPLKKLMECKITKDFKYILFDGKFYSTKTGNEVSLNEGWLTNTLRTGADMLSMGLDFVFPGTGAIVDALNALSMLIEAQFKSGAEKDSLYIMAIIQFGFILLPGPLQAMAPMLRNAVKTGKGLNSTPVKKGLGIIGGGLNTIFGGLNSIIQRATKSKLAKRLLGKWGPKINEFVSNFKNRIKTIFDSFKTNKGGRNVAGQDLNRQNAFGSIGPIVLGQDVAGKNLKSGVGGVKRPGEIQQTNFESPSKTSGESLPPSGAGVSNNITKQEPKIKLPDTNISNTNMDSENFKKKFSHNYTQDDYKRSPDEVTKLLNNVNFSSNSYKIRNMTTHSQGQKAVEVITPNNSSVVLYQSKNFHGFVPISGYHEGDANVDKELMKLPYIKDLMNHFNNNQNQIFN